MDHSLVFDEKTEAEIKGMKFRETSLGQRTTTYRRDPEIQAIYDGCRQCKELRAVEDEVNAISHHRHPHLLTEDEYRRQRAAHKKLSKSIYVCSDCGCKVLAIYRRQRAKTAAEKEVANALAVPAAAVSPVLWIIQRRRRLMGQ